jgi:short-subunit dehydrogenase
MSLIQTQFTNPGYALITGASSGIGECFAEKFSSLGFSLILVARREDRLKLVAQKLETQNKTQIIVIPADLSEKSGIEKIIASIEKIEKIDVLVNNAGFGTFGKFAYNPLEKSMNMITVHNIAPVILTHAILNKMLLHNRGIIINVASIGAKLPLPGNLMYSTTKAFLKSFSENLAAEYANQGIIAQALCPGLTRTEFHHVGDYQKHEISSSPESLWSNVDEVVSKSLAAIEKKKVVVIPGFKHRLNSWLMEHTFLGSMIQKKFRDDLDNYYASKENGQKD